VFSGDDQAESGWGGFWGLGDGVEGWGLFWSGGGVSVPSGGERGEAQADTFCGRKLVFFTGTVKGLGWGGDGSFC